MSKNKKLPKTVLIRIRDRDNEVYEAERAVDDTGSVDLSGIAPDGVGPYDIQIISTSRKLSYEFSPEW